jgi:hypothetical protein
VLAGRVRTALERPIAADQVDVEAPRDSRRWAGVARHYALQPSSERSLC